MCHTKDQVEQVRHRLAGWLAPRGLAFNEDKTHIVHVERGFDFLGFNVRRYDGKLLIKPSKAAVRRIRQRLAAEVRSLNGSNAIAVIRRLNPIIRGWAAYYRGVVAKEVFYKVDHYLWGRLYRWARLAHPNKSRYWVVDRYFGMFHPSRNDRWVFGDRDSGAYLRRFGWTKIVRPKMVMGTASPDDPALDWYWAARRRSAHAQVGGRTASLLFRQQGRCAACGTLLLHAEQGPQSPQEWEQWTRTLTKALRKTALVIGEADGDDPTTRLMHTHCRQREQRQRQRDQRKQDRTPKGLA